MSPFPAKDTLCAVTEVPCCKCGAERPITEMRLDYGEHRQPQMMCGACYSRKLCLENAIADEVEARQRKEEFVIRKENEKDKRLLSQAVRVLQSPHVCEVTEALVDRFGGMGGFVDFIHFQICVAAMTRPGSKVVMDGIRTMLNLVDSSTRNRRSAPDVEGMSDEEIEREIGQVVSQKLRVLKPPALCDESQGAVRDEQFQRDAI